MAPPRPTPSIACPPPHSWSSRHPADPYMPRRATGHDGSRCIWPSGAIGMHLSALCVHSHFSLGKHDVFTQWATGAFDSLSWVKLRTVCTSSLLSLAFDSLLYLRGIPSDAIGPHTWRADITLDYGHTVSWRPRSLPDRTRVHACRAAYTSRFGCPRGLRVVVAVRSFPPEWRPPAPVLSLSTH